MKHKVVRGTGLLLAALVIAIIAFIISARIIPIVPLHDRISVSRQVYAEDGELLRVTRAEDGQFRLWVPLEQINQSMIDVLLFKEDRDFYHHYGINPVALARAMVSTYSGGSRQGASTVTMQLARRLYSIDSRHIPGKIRQMLLAIWLECRYSKHDILEAYLNLVPMGGNIEGVEAASQIYFHRPALRLSFAESLALAVIPQYPARGGFGSNMQRARLVLLHKWRRAFPHDKRDSALLDLPVTAFTRSQLPFNAPHLSQQLLSQYPHRIQLHTTLSLPLQQLLERVLQQYVTTHHDQQINNAAAILVDTNTHEVKALIGSADFHSVAISGQIDGTLAQRSPGSALKPFLYGLALDKGLIHPLSMLPDAPSSFGAYQPENFDQRFMGPITAEDALIRSRNVPAVWLANKLPQGALHDLLVRGGVRHLQRAEHYGLGLVLGGGEISMQELATLYLALALDGRVHPLRFLNNPPSDQEGDKLLSAQASFIVRDMLRHNPRPDGLPGYSAGRQWDVAWKTGTSWGFHDAWSIGIAGHYVLGVWIGNFNGRNNPAFIGQEAAGPLFFNMVDALMAARPQDTGRSDLLPKGVESISICRESGDLPNRWCPSTRKGWFIPGVSPIRVSTLHQRIPIDTRTGEMTCTPFDPDHVRWEVMALWPSDMQALFRAAGLPRKEPPPLSSNCHASFNNYDDESPHIQSPLANVTYSLRLSAPSQTIPLDAAVGGDSRRLYWFANQRLLGQAMPGHTVEWRPSHSGEYRIHVSDDLGRSAERELRIEFLP